MYSTKPLVGLSAPCDCLVGAVTAAGADSGYYTDGPPPGWNYNGTPASGPYAPILVSANAPTKLHERLHTQLALATLDGVPLLSDLEEAVGTDREQLLNDTNDIIGGAESNLKGASSQANV